MSNYLIDACDFILSKVKPFQTFQLDEVLSTFDVSKYGSIMVTLHEADMNKVGDDIAIFKFMSDEGYIKCDKYEYSLTDLGRLVQSVGGHIEYSGNFKAQQKALLKQPAYNYKTRKVAFIASFTAITISLAVLGFNIYVYTTTHSLQPQSGQSPKQEMKVEYPKFAPSPLGVDSSLPPKKTQ